MTGTGPVTLAFTEHDQKIILISNDFRNRWPSEILRENRASLVLDGKKIYGSARLITSPSAKRDIIRYFINKYGNEYVDRYFNDPGRFIEVDCSGNLTGNIGDYYSWLEDEFDNIAEEYDVHIFGNKVNSLLRERSVHLMKRVFKGKKRLLEIGCGTGTETIELMRMGFEITATDISSRMLDQLKLKARDEGLEEQLELVRVKAGEISSLSLGREGPLFDGIYSNYGALNCEENIQGISPQISSLMREGCYFVAGIYNRLCISEILAYALTFQLTKAIDRTKRFSMEGHSRFCIDVYSYTPGEFYSFFKGHFFLRSIEGVPVIIPPSNLVNYVEKFSSHFDLISKIDRRIGSIWPFKYLGDHFLMVMEKRNLEEMKIPGIYA